MALPKASPEAPVLAQGGGKLGHVLPKLLLQHLLQLAPPSRIVAFDHFKSQRKRDPAQLVELLYQRCSSARRGPGGIIIIIIGAKS
jgi:hypothetical protein